MKMFQTTTGWKVFSFGFLLGTMLMVQSCVHSPRTVQHIPLEEGLIYSVPAQGIQLDGRLNEPFWLSNQHEATNVTEGEPGSSNNRVFFSSAWDSEFLYVGIKVEDDQVVNNQFPINQLWQDDTIEIFLSADNNGLPGYSATDFQVFIRVQDMAIYSVTASAPNSLSNRIRVARIIEDWGYTMEVAIPWVGMNVSPQVGTVIGFDLAVDDSDVQGSAGGRTHALTWNNTRGNNFQTTEAFGELVLIGNILPETIERRQPRQVEEEIQDIKTRRLNLETPMLQEVRGIFTPAWGDDSFIVTIEAEPSFGEAEVRVNFENQLEITYRSLIPSLGYDRFIIYEEDILGNKLHSEVWVLVNYEPTFLTYYVSSERGSDTNSGLDENEPLGTIQEAHNRSKPGDTIFVMNGVYGQTSGEGVVNITRSGLSNAYISYKAFPGHRPILTVEDAWNHIRVTGAAYIILDGFVIRGNVDRITPDQARAVYDYMVEKTTNNDWGSIDWGYVGSTNTNGISVASDGDIFSHHIEIRNMEVSDLPGGGIGVSYGDYILIENNRVWNTSIYSIWGNSGISLYNLSNFDENEETYRNRIVNNIAFRNRTTIPWFQIQAMSDGNGIIVDDLKNEQRPGFEPYRGWTLVENNLTYLNGGSGIHSFSSDRVHIFQNTAYMNNTTEELQWGQIFASSSSDVVIARNVLYGNGGKINETFGNENVVYQDNIYFNGRPMVMGEGDELIDPGFVNPAQENFRFMPGSPALSRSLGFRYP